MDCEKNRSFFPLYFEEETKPDDRLILHLEQCPACFAELQHYKQIQDRLIDSQHNRGKAPLSNDFLIKIETGIKKKASFYKHYPRTAYLIQQNWVKTAAGVLFLATLIPLLPLSLPNGLFSQSDSNSQIQTQPISTSFPKKHDCSSCSKTDYLMPCIDESLMNLNPLKKGKGKFLMNTIPIHERDWGYNSSYYSKPIFKTAKTTPSF